jgi:hypothetical protein
MAEHDDKTAPEVGLPEDPGAPRPALGTGTGPLVGERQDTRSLLSPPPPDDPFGAPPAPPAQGPPAAGGRGLALGLAAALALSLAGNAALLVRGTDEAPPETPTAPAALPPVCPPAVCPPPVACPACEICAVCPELEIPDEVFTGTGRVRPPPVDEAAAAEGEAHLTHAETVGERDPVEVAAQRRVADGVDRILASRSAAAARRFFGRNLPSFASMDCAFRDPAAAEHVRMQLRPMNELLPEDERLSEADLARFERDLRCPRE